MAELKFVPHSIVYTNDDMFYILRAMPTLDQMNKNKDEDEGTHSNLTTTTGCSTK
jgi:hypothetical protein